MYCGAVRAGMVGLGAILVAMIGLRPAGAEKQPEPPDDTARRAVEALPLELGEHDYWTDQGVLARGVVCLTDYDWAEEEPWVAPFAYEWLLQTKRTRVEPIPRYTVEMVAEHAGRLRELPWVQPSVRADSRLVLGLSQGWPEGHPLEGWQLGDPTVPPQDVYGYVSTFPVFDGNWRHLAFTYQPGDAPEQDGRLRVFVDGVELREHEGLEILDDDPVSQLFASTAPLQVGAWTEPGRFFRGEMDELAIWDSALDAAQIKWLAENSLREFDRTDVP